MERGGIKREGEEKGERCGRKGWRGAEIEGGRKGEGRDRRTGEGGETGRGEMETAE